MLSGVRVRQFFALLAIANSEESREWPRPDLNRYALLEQGILSPQDDQHKLQSGQRVTQTDPENLAQTLSRKTQTDPDLARIVEAWPTLPEALRAGIVAMVKATGKGG